MKKGIKLSSPIFTVIFLLITVWTCIFVEHNMKQNIGIIVDYDTEISGIASYATNNRGNISLTLKRPKEVKYHLTPTRNYNYKPYDLDDFIQGGDSVYKPSSNDTLYIFRNNKRYFFIINEVINYKE